MQSVPDSGLSRSQPGGGAPDQGAPGSQSSAGMLLPESAAHRAARQEPAADGAKAGSQPLKPAAASASNACTGERQEDMGYLEPSPWRVKRRKENSAPSSPEQLAKHAGQGLFASTPAGSSLGHGAAGQHDSLPADQDHAFSQEAAAAGKSLMAALRAAGISPRSSDGLRPSDALPESDETGPPKGTAAGAVQSTAAAAAPTSSGKAPAGSKSAASQGMSQPSDVPHRGASRPEAPTREHSQAPPQRKAAQSNSMSSVPGHSARGHAEGHTDDAPHSSMPDEVERVDGVSDAGERDRSQHGPDEMDPDMDVDVVGPPEAAARCGAAGAADLDMPSSAQPGDAPSELFTTGALAAAPPHGAPVMGTGGAAAPRVIQSVGILCKYLCPSDLQSPASPGAHELKAEGLAAGGISAEGASSQAAQAVSLSPGDAPAAELCALALPTAPERLPSAELCPPAADSQAAARSCALHGIPLPASAHHGHVGSAGDTGVLAVQSTVMCTEVQAVPCTLVEPLPAPQPFTGPHAGAAAAPAVDSNHKAGSPHPQHGSSGRAAAAGLDNSWHIHPQVLQHHRPLSRSCAATAACRSLGVCPCVWHQAQAYIHILEDEGIFWPTGDSRQR